MILKVKNHKYADSQSRINFARFLSLIIDADKDFSPYMPNQNDDTFWTLDSGNDWKIVFNERDGFETFRLFYRYNAGYPEYERALFGWLKIKMRNLELIEESV